MNGCFLFGVHYLPHCRRMTAVKRSSEKDGKADTKRRRFKEAASSASDSSSDSSSQTSDSDSSSQTSDSSSSSSSLATSPAASEWIDGEFVLKLQPGAKADQAKVKVRQFQGKVYVDIRKYYDNGTKPTPKGVSLKPELFQKLVELGELISDAQNVVQGRQTSLDNRFVTAQATVVRDGNEVYITAELDAYHVVKIYKFKNMILIDVRNLYKGAPTKKGISLPPDAFAKMVGWEGWKAAVQQLS